MPNGSQIDQLSSVINFAARGLTMLCVTIDDELVAMFGFKSVIRLGAAGVVQELPGVKSRYTWSAATRLTPFILLPETSTFPWKVLQPRRTPVQKQEYIRQLMDNSKITLFCGDGTNDAVAVAQANIGVQIESSSDVTRATADVILLHNLDGVLNLLDVSTAAFRRIVFNFCWSATYNVLAILLAGGACIKIRILPAYAGVGEVVSVVPIIVAALPQPKVKSRCNEIV